MGKDLFLSNYTNKKGEEKFSLGMSKQFINSLYELDTASFEQLLDVLSDNLEVTSAPDEVKVDKLKEFLINYFSI